MHRFLLLGAVGLASCATGVDSATDDGTTPAYDAGSPADGGAAGDGSDAGSSHADAGGTPDGAQAPDEGTGAGEAGAADGGSTDDAGSASDGGAAETGPGSDGGSSTCPGHGTTGVLVTFDLSSQSGSEASAPATKVATSVTSGALTRASGLDAVSGSGSINASGWPTAGSADATKYYTFTVTPASGCTVTLGSLALDVSASATGPKNGDVATSADAFAGHTTSFAGTATPTVTLSGVGGTGAVEVRVYGYGAGGSAGTFRIENTVTVSGTIE
ncbi:MAG TPA: hypothetical protein VGG39_22095 [Polyangiaceae bacterium]|jgi:hypothetical protein